MKLTDGKALEAMGILPEHHYFVQPDSRFVGGLRFNGYDVFLVLTPEQQAELAEDRLLVQSLVCLPDNAAEVRGSYVGHCHKVALGIGRTDGSR